MGHTNIRDTCTDANSHLGGCQKCSPRVIRYFDSAIRPLLDLVTECLTEYRIFVYHGKIICEFELDRFSRVAQSPGTKTKNNDQ
jgi:hypothetical protein